MKTYLVLDCNYLAYRSFFSTGGLSFKGSPTGTIFGFLKNLSFFQDQFNTSDLIFAFDHGSNLRAKASPSYKAHRRDKVLTEEEQIKLNDMRNQVNLLKNMYLKQVGFKNILKQKGYEADDMIAKFCLNNLDKKDKAIIVSGDKDLWQLLREGKVMCYDPNKKQTMTEDKFKEEWKIEPRAWSDIKAIAGCKSDGVVGVKGVGEKTAAKYLRHEVTIRIQDKIDSSDIVVPNLKLISLPYEGTKPITIHQDKFSREAWNRLVESLGMQTLTRNAPRRSFGLGSSK